MPMLSVPTPRFKPGSVAQPAQSQVQQVLREAPTPAMAQDGASLTPEQVARKRAIAEQLAQSGMDYSPVQHWTQGLARVANALAGNLEESRAAKAEKEGTDKASQAFNDALEEKDPQARMTKLLAAAENPWASKIVQSYLGAEMAKANEKTAQPFAGSGFDSTAANILVQGQNDPAIRSSPQYALAYANQFKPVVVPGPNGPQIYTPPKLPGILPPMSAGQAPPQVRQATTPGEPAPAQAPARGAPQPPPGVKPDRPGVFFDPDMHKDTLGDGMMPPPIRDADYAAGPQAAPNSTGTLTPIPGAQPNPIAAEVASRVGLAKGFLEKYDDIHSKLEKLGTVSGRLGLLVGTGEAAEIERHIETGAEALIRQLTGAGKSQEEATSYAKRYLPSPFDQAFDTKSKLEGLRYDLEHAVSGVMEGRGGFKSPAGKTGSAAGDVKEGTTGKSKSGKPIVFKGGKWEYVD